MASTLLTKKSTVAGKAPAAADLQLGELAINVADGRLFAKKSDGSIFVLNPMYGLTPTMVSVDMGSTPVTAKSFSVTVPGIVAGGKVICSVSGDQALGSMIDELELEPLVAFGRVASANTLELTVACADREGVTSGVKYINFYVG